MKRLKRWWRIGTYKSPVYTCEICKSEGVTRLDIWDYCPKGHVYVGERHSPIG